MTRIREFLAALGCDATLALDRVHFRWMVSSRKPRQGVPRIWERIVSREFQDLIAKCEPRWVG